MSDDSKYGTYTPPLTQAFPSQHGIGMTLRDYFAAKAMQGMLSAGEFYWSENVAFRAYEQADAMLAERNKT